MPHTAVLPIELYPPLVIIKYKIMNQKKNLNSYY